MEDLQTVRFTISGIGQMIMHNGRTADPLDQFSRTMKQLSGKRGKTDEDLAVLSNLEWWAGLYADRELIINEDASVTAPDNTKLIIPSHLLDSVIREGARKSKKGKLASAGVVVEGDGVFTYEGQGDLNKLCSDNSFQFRRAVKVGQSKVMRNRPIFNKWQIQFVACIDPGVIELQDVKTALTHAGRLIGIGDWRPGAPKGGSYGRFTLTDATVLSPANEQ